jgi:hypothetical protein
VTSQQIHAGATPSGVGTNLRELIDMVRHGLTFSCEPYLRGIQKPPSPRADLVHLRRRHRPPVADLQRSPHPPCDFITDTENHRSAAFGAGGTDHSPAAWRPRPSPSRHDPNAPDDPSASSSLAIGEKDASRTRLKAYTALGVKASQAIARLDGISSGDWTN